MARLVKHDSGIEDELPELDVLLEQSIGEQERKLKPSASRPQKNKDMSSASSTAKRRVRRLDNQTQDTLNPLFRPWNAETQSASTLDILPKRSSSNMSKSERESTKRQVTTFKQRPSENGYQIIETHRTTSSGFEARHDSDSTQRTHHFSQLQLEGLYVPRRATEASRVSTEETLKHAARSGRPARFGQQYVDQPITTISDEEGADECSVVEGDSSEYNDSDESDSSSDSLYDTLSRISRRNLRSHNQEILFQDDTTPISPQSSNKHIGKKLDINMGETPGKRPEGNNGAPKSSNLADSLSKLRLQFEDDSDEYYTPERSKSLEAPFLAPPRKNILNGLSSPRKQTHIPETPHKPSVDTFWNQEFVDKWNEQYSPHKPNRSDALVQKQTKKNPKKETKKSFDARKDRVARDFLSQLDDRITDGRIAQLAASTGGVKIVWSKTLNTTAGRANWRRETIRTKQGGSNSQVAVEHKHHAFIELAEKVIDEEDRLLNVLAHEFCHLANFMINGITTNPHGKEFKAWAAKCSREFAAQGIKVTTKHAYEIDFKYIWTCGACAAQYKRHSKSIDPSRHRCGTCKGPLTQIKPTPRGAATTSKPSAYQLFMKEQMKIVRRENPGSPQKEVMKIIAGRWSKRAQAKESQQETKENSSSILDQLVELSLENERCI